MEKKHVLLFDAILVYLEESGGDGDAWIVVENDPAYGDLPRIHLANDFVEWNKSRDFKGQPSEDGTACFCRPPEEAIYIVKSRREAKGDIIVEVWD